MKKYLKTNSNTKYGAFFDEKVGKVVFKLKSQTATDATLCVFKRPIGENPFLEIEMEKKGDVFEAEIKKENLFLKKDVIYYGYRVFGANFPKTPNYKTSAVIICL